MYYDAGKVKSVDYKGGRTAKEIVEFGMEKAKNFALKRIGAKPSGSGGAGGSAGGAGGASGGAAQRSSVVSCSLVLARITAHEDCVTHIAVQAWQPRAVHLSQRLQARLTELNASQPQTS